MALSTESLVARKARRGFAESAVCGVGSAILTLLFLQGGGPPEAPDRLQSAADAAARALAARPFAPEGRFVDALNAPTVYDGEGCEVSAAVFDETKLVVFESAVRTAEGKGFDDSSALDAYFARLPPINRELRPFMYFDRFGSERIFRYPGVLVQAKGGMTVHVPVVARTNANELRIVRMRVVEESAPTPAAGLFPIGRPGVEVREENQGFVRLRVLHPRHPSAPLPYVPDAAGRARGSVRVVDATPRLGGAWDDPTHPQHATPVAEDADGPLELPTLGAVEFRAGAANRIQLFKSVESVQATCRREAFRPAPASRDALSAR